MDIFSGLSAARFFQHPFCMDRSALFFYPIDYFNCRGRQGVLQPLLRKRTAVFIAGRTVWPVPQKRSAEIFAQQVVPLRVSALFLYDVFPDAVEHLAGI